MSWSAWSSGHAVGSCDKREGSSRPKRVAPDGIEVALDGAGHVIDVAEGTPRGARRETSGRSSSRMCRNLEKRIDQALPYVLKIKHAAEAV